MLLRAYLILGLAVSMGFSAAAVSGWRMFPRIGAAGGAGSAAGRSSGIFYGGGHSTSGSHSTWHGGK